MPKIIHFRNKCIGCNSCVEHAPEFWIISKEDGKSNLHASSVKGEVYIRKIEHHEVEKNKHAEKDCPVHIIKVIE